MLEKLWPVEKHTLTTERRLESGQVYEVIKEQVAPHIYVELRREVLESTIRGQLIYVYLDAPSAWVRKVCRDGSSPKARRFGLCDEGEGRWDESLVACFSDNLNWWVMMGDVTLPNRKIRMYDTALQAMKRGIRLHYAGYELDRGEEKRDPLGFILKTRWKLLNQLLKTSRSEGEKRDTELEIEERAGKWWGALVEAYQEFDAPEQKLELLFGREGTPGDKEWGDSFHEDLLEAYQGEWVAISGRRVVAHGEDYGAVKKLAKKLTQKENFVMRQMVSVDAPESLRNALRLFRRPRRKYRPSQCPTCAFVGRIEQTNRRICEKVVGDPYLVGETRRRCGGFQEETKEAT